MADYGSFFRRDWPLLQQAGLFLPHPNPTFRNPAFGEADFRVLIVRLSPFRDVDRSTPHLVLSQAVRRALPEAYVDVVFFPPKHDRERLRRAGIPLLVGVQSFRSVEEFDLVLVSNSYLLELVNLPYLLLHSGIPSMASGRGEEWPPIILGGSNAMATQAVVTADGDSLVDALFFGEGEEQLIPLLRGLRDTAGSGKRLQLSRVASAVDGLWVSGLGTDCPVAKAVLDAPAEEHLLIDYPLLNGPEAQTARLQIGYGCPAFCSFCFEGYDRKPYREVGLADVLSAAHQLKRSHGCEALDLYSFNFNTHSAILALIGELNHLYDRVNFMSQRVDLLDCARVLLEAEIAAGKSHFSLGIEGISERQRAWLHKSLSTKAIERVLERLVRHKVRQVKLFYILTGHEDESDLAEFRGFVSWLKALRTRRHPAIRVTFSFGRLVRMPFTPLRYDRLLLQRDDWRAVAGQVKSACETNGFEFRMAAEWDEYCTSQVLALGGHWLLRALTELAQEGHVFEGRLSPGYWDALRNWLVAHGFWTDAFLGEKGADYSFPMSFVRSSIKSSFLHRQFEQAKAGVDEGYCLGDAVSPGRCLGCGACEEEAQRRAITAQRLRPAGNERYVEQLRSMMAAKRRIRPLYVRVRLPRVVAGTATEWTNAWLLRMLLRDNPLQTDNLLSAREALFAVGANRDRYPTFYGETVIALRAWDEEALTAGLLGGTTGARLAAPARAEYAGSEGLSALAPEGACGRCGEVEILGSAEGFKPGEFKQVRVSLKLPEEHFAGAGRRLVEFLRASYVPCNVQRAGKAYALVLPKKALKKKSVISGEYEENSDLCTIELVIGPKFDLGAYLRSFGDPERCRQAQVAFRELVW